MSQFTGVTGTNRFKIKDRRKFYDLLDKVETEHGVEIDRVFSKINLDNTWTVEFAVEDIIFGVYDTEDDCPFNNFVKELQKLLTDDSVCIYNEIGHENTEYLMGNSLIITHNKVEKVNLYEGVKEVITKLGMNDVENIISGSLVI